MINCIRPAQQALLLLALVFLALVNLAPGQRLPLQWNQINREAPTPLPTTGQEVPQQQQQSVQQPQWNYPEKVEQQVQQQLPTAERIAPPQTGPTGFAAPVQAAALLASPLAAVASPFDERISDAIALSVLRFGHAIAQQLSEITAGGGKTEVFSPVSVLSCLALVMLGARGTTYAELERLFGLGPSGGDALLRSLDVRRFHEELSNMLADLQMPGLSLHERRRHMAKWRYSPAGYSIRHTNMDNAQPLEHIVQLANGVFTQFGYTLNPSYRSVVRSVYHSAYKPLDFDYQPRQSADFINAWVSNATHGKIPNIIPGDIAKGTNLILASALYFKGFWENSFFESATMEDKFYVDGVSAASVKVQMMATGGIFPFYDAVEEDCRLIGLPYRGNFTTMYVIQPNKSTRAKLSDLLKRLTGDSIDAMIERMEQKSAVVAFPKMHVQRSVNMKQLLRRLGVQEIFASGRSDLSLIEGSGVRGREPAAAATATAQSSAPAQSATAWQRPNLHEGLIVSRFGGVEDEHNATSSNSAAAAAGIKGGRQGRWRRQAGRVPILDRRRIALDHLEGQREAIELAHAPKSNLFVEDVLHKVDIEVNEHGTEAAAATLTYLRRSGTDVLFRADAPFLFLIRHDPTKLVLFYGIVNEPEL